MGADDQFAGNLEYCRCALGLRVILLMFNMETKNTSAATMPSTVVDVRTRPYKSITGRCGGARDQR